MAHIPSYSHVTTATIPAAAWYDAWPLLAGWRDWLLSQETVLTVQHVARKVENGDVRVMVIVQWEEPEQRDTWSQQAEWRPQRILERLRHPAYDISEEAFEDVT